MRNFRLFLFGHLVSSTGTWMQQVGQDWLVLRLTDAPLPLGITLALQFAPMLAFGAWAGLVADRADKRRLLLATQTAMAVLALVLGTLTATGAVRLWMVYVLALLLGVATAFDMPARQAFVSEMVGPDRVVNAVGLNSASFNTARVLGPAVAGALIAVVGIAPAFFVNAVSYLAMIGGLLAMDPDRLYRRAAVERGRGQIRAGIRYVWATPVLRSTIVLVAVVGMLGLNYRVALPLLARFAFDGGPGVYGALAAVMAAGSVVGALAVARRGRPTRALLVGSVAAFGLLSFAAALAPSIVVEAAFLFPIGAASLAFVATANSTVQLASSPEMRGRVMSLFGLVLLGSGPPSGLLSGWMAGQFGPRSILILSGVSCVLAATVATLAARRRTEPPTAEADGVEQAA
ncbi:MAG TPA: MFS transporter [Actinomycetes bacterium]|nr:MFS transporter [Actinomycetes bacterium]HEX2156870.1 MFS transporter [Actinomycetes bacterium]